MTSRISIAPPKTQEILMQRAQKLAGKTIGEIAENLNYQVPETLKRKKGWQGQFLELCLGADANNLSQPDFNHLNIELKTIPINYAGKVLESTYVCVLGLKGQPLLQWEHSAVFRKLQKVLWIPIARAVNKPIIQSRVATPYLWSPNRSQLDILKKDWENAMEMVSLGKIDQLNARIGQILQVRPKAANSKVLTQTTDQQGHQIETLPRGFYLRPAFTQQILLENLIPN